MTANATVASSSRRRRRRTAAAPATVVAYTRVSTEEQAISGAGLAAQRTTIETEAALRGWTIVEWHSDEGISGGKGIEDRWARPRYLRASARPDERPLRVQTRMAGHDGTTVGVEEQRCHALEFVFRAGSGTPAGSSSAKPTVRRSGFAAPPTTIPSAHEKPVGHEPQSSSALLEAAPRR
jgi:hypothetical protein